MTRAARNTPEAGDAQFEAGLRASAQPGAAAAREAVRWFKQAARAGHLDALLNLGCHFRDGLGVRRSISRARRCFEAAATRGSPEAMACLGRLLLETGRSVADRRNGLRWLRQAVARGDWSAAHFLGRAAEETGNWSTAERWYRHALESGDLISGLRLAKHYLDKLNQRYHPLGVTILKRAIRQSAMDPAWGYTELAKCHLQGRGARRSREQALSYLKLAAASDPEARQLLEILRRPKPPST